MKLETRRAKIAELLGLDWQPPTPEEPRTEANDLVSREAEAVLGYLTTPLGNHFVLHQFRERQCKFCEVSFITSLANVGYCSDECRQKALKEYGIKWNPEKPAEERWAGIPQPVDHKLGFKFADEVAVKRLNEVPLTIGAEATQVLQELNLEDQPQELHTQNPQPEPVNGSLKSLSIQEILDGSIDDLLG